MERCWITDGLLESPLYQLVGTVYERQAQRYTEREMRRWTMPIGHGQQV